MFHFSTLCTVEISEFHCHATVFSQKFRQINVSKELYYTLDLTEKNLHGSEFLVFPHFEYVTQWCDNYGNLFLYLL